GSGAGHSGSIDRGADRSSGDTAATAAGGGQADMSSSRTGLPADCFCYCCHCYYYYYYYYNYYYYSCFDRYIAGFCCNCSFGYNLVGCCAGYYYSASASL